MNDQIVRTLVLSGNDAENFANAFFKPSVETIRYNKEVIDSINEKVVINRTTNGYDAEIEDLD